MKRIDQGWRTMLVASAVGLAETMSALGAELPARSQATVAPFAVAPTIDGTLTSGEWDGALGTGSFADWRSGELNARQGYARLGWTAERLYLLVVAEVPPGYTAPGPVPRDREAIMIAQPTVECWIDPHHDTRASGTGDLHYYQSMLDAGGNVIDIQLDSRHAQDDRWDAHWQIAAQRDPQSGLWVTEASVPWADFGITGSPAGRTIGVLLGYNYQWPFTQRLWMPLGDSPTGYTNPGAFAAITLQPGAPTVQVSGLGEHILEGELDLQLTVATPGAAQAVRVRAELTVPGAEPLRDDQTLACPAGGRTAYRWQPAARPPVGKLAQLRLAVTSADGATVYFADQRCWRTVATPPVLAWQLPPPPWHDADPAANTRTLAAITPEIGDRAILQTGDTARLQRVLAQARRGEPVTIALIGGSVTQGAGGSNGDRTCYAALFANWWRVKFPQSKISYVNAGSGGTGSLYGTHRLQRDVLSHHPDLVVVEFSINDTDTELLGQTYEGVMRQLLRAPGGPAVISFTVWGGKGHLGHPSTWHEKVARHYSLPMISARAAFSPEFLAQRLRFEDAMADVIHPNDLGHRLLAATLLTYCERVYATLPADAALPAPGPVPAPLLTDRFEQAAIIAAGDLTVTTAKDCVRRYGAWHSGFPDSVLTFTYTGAGSLTLGYERSSVKQMAAAEVRVDDRPPVILDAAWNLSFGLAQQEQVAKDLPPGEHTVTLRTIASPSSPWKPWQPQYNGFTLHYIMTASSPVAAHPAESAP